MLTKIFTGHTLDLTHIVAVSPPVAITKIGQYNLETTLVCQITLKHTPVVLQYEFGWFRFSEHHSNEKETQAYNRKFDELQGLINELIEQWRAELDRVAALTQSKYARLYNGGSGTITNPHPQ